MLLVSLVYVLRFSLRKLLKVCPFDKKTSVQLSQTSVHRRYLWCMKYESATLRWTIKMQFSGKILKIEKRRSYPLIEIRFYWKKEIIYDYALKSFKRRLWLWPQQQQRFFCIIRLFGQKMKSINFHQRKGLCSRASV